MLDKRTNYLLNYINRECSLGSFRIFGPLELLTAFPVKYNVDSDGLLLILDYLKEREYITIKYQDEKSICLAPLPKGRLVHEEQEANHKEKMTLRKMLALAFFMCFLGGLLGSLLSGFVRALFGG